MRDHRQRSTFSAERNRPPYRSTAASVRKTVLITVATLLIIAIGLILYGQSCPLEQTFHGKLADLLPPAPYGWTRTERPIADTPEMKKKVGELLSYDDGVLYDYTNGALRLSVYIAYWAPGKMSSRLIAGHTPDVCWVDAGWECIAQQTVNSIAVDSRQLIAVETRAFTAGMTTEYVWFWHLVGGEPQSYSTGGKPPWYALFTNMFTRGFRQREEQFFIRLSSPQKLDDPTLTPALVPVLKALMYSAFKEKRGRTG